MPAGGGGIEQASPPPIGVMGESAGGNLAAVMCLLARGRGGPKIGHQALLCTEQAAALAQPTAGVTGSAG